jgi:hypothetical protein
VTTPSEKRPSIHGYSLGSIASPDAGNPRATCAGC